PPGVHPPVLGPRHGVSADGALRPDRHVDGHHPVRSRMAPSWREVALAALAAGAVIAYWRAPQSESADVAGHDSPVPQRASAPGAPRERVLPAGPGAPKLRTTSRRASHEPVTHHEPETHPHPVTEEHERIFAVNRTIQALNDAMALRDVERMRELLVTYQTLDPSDLDGTHLGYEVIAACIEAPGDASLR